VIENGVDDGIDPVAFGCIMVAINLLIVGSVLFSGFQKHVAARKARHETKARTAQSVEWACGFDATKFQVISRLKHSQVLFCHLTGIPITFFFFLI
jgi:hypothetical protein